MVCPKKFRKGEEHVCAPDCQQWVALEERDDPPQFLPENAYPTELTGDEHEFLDNDRGQRVVEYVIDHMEMMTVNKKPAEEPVERQAAPQKYAPSAVTSESTLTEGCTVPTLVDDNHPTPLTEFELHRFDEQAAPPASSKATGRSKSHATDTSGWSWEGVSYEAHSDSVVGTGTQFDEEAAGPYSLDGPAVLVIEGIDE